MYVWCVVCDADLHPSASISQPHKQTNPAQKHTPTTFQGPRMDKAFLEDDEEIDHAANVRSIKANVMAGGRRGRYVLSTRMDGCPA